MHDNVGQNLGVVSVTWPEGQLPGIVLCAGGGVVVTDPDCARVILGTAPVVKAQLLRVENQY
jgi:hypothetical protein